MCTVWNLALVDFAPTILRADSCKFSLRLIWIGLSCSWVSVNLFLFYGGSFDLPCLLLQKCNVTLLYIPRHPAVIDSEYFSISIVTVALLLFSDTDPCPPNMNHYGIFPAWHITPEPWRCHIAPAEVKFKEACSLGLITHERLRQHKCWFKAKTKQNKIPIKKRYAMMIV